MKATKQPFYFRFVVADHYSHEFRKFSPAQRFAKRIKEKIYLQIFLKSNTYNEPYDEVVISDISEVESAQQTLIANIQKYLTN